VKDDGQQVSLAANSGVGTRFRVLAISDHNNTKTAIDFQRGVREHFPFAIQTI